MADEPNKVPDELSQIDSDIEAAKQSLVSKETQKQIEAVKEQTRKETEEQIMLKLKLEKLEKENQDLKAAQEAKEKQTLVELEALKQKLNSFVGSRAPVRVEDPFKQPEQAKTSIDRLSDAEIQAIERASAEQFFGTNYDHFLKSMRD